MAMGGGGMGMGMSGMGEMFGQFGDIFQMYGQRQSETRSRRRMRDWIGYLMGLGAPARSYYNWLIELSRNQEKYPEFMEGYMEHLMPQIGEWATAGGVYNPAAVSRKATENLFPYLMQLGQAGAAGLVGATGGMPQMPMQYFWIPIQLNFMEEQVRALTGSC